MKFQSGPEPCWVFASADPYVKVSLICDGRRLKKRKTTTKKNTLNPVYNEAIIFDIPPENVEQVSLSIMVMDYDRWVVFAQEPGVILAYNPNMKHGLGVMGWKARLWQTEGAEEVEKHVK